MINVFEYQQIYEEYAVVNKTIIIVIYQSSILQFIIIVRNW